MQTATGYRRARPRRCMALNLPNPLRRGSRKNDIKEHKTVRYEKGMDLKKCGSYHDFCNELRSAPATGPAATAGRSAA